MGCHRVGNDLLTEEQKQIFPSVFDTCIYPWLLPFQSYLIVSISQLCCFTSYYAEIHPHFGVFIVTHLSQHLSDFSMSHDSEVY